MPAIPWIASIQPPILCTDCIFDSILLVKQQQYTITFVRQVVFNVVYQGSILIQQTFFSEWKKHPSTNPSPRDRIHLFGLDQNSHLLETQGSTWCLGRSSTFFLGGFFKVVLISSYISPSFWGCNITTCTQHDTSFRKSFWFISPALWQPTYW